jgi:uncharacterized membrane protein
MKRSLMTAAGLGAVSGLRTAQALAWLSRELSHGRPTRDGSSLERWLSTDIVTFAIATAAAGELVVDKLPNTPDRIRPHALLGRAVAGAMVGAIAAGRDRQMIGAAIGAGSAVASAYAGWLLRREASRVTFLPDIAVAIAEDALAAALARRLVGAS